MPLKSIPVTLIPKNVRVINTGAGKLFCGNFNKGSEERKTENCSNL